jgi:hypothetical protein
MVKYSFWAWRELRAAVKLPYFVEGVTCVGELGRHLRYSPCGDLFRK